MQQMKTKGCRLKGLVGRRKRKKGRGRKGKKRRRKKRENRNHDQIYGSLFNRAVKLHYWRCNINRDSEAECRSFAQVSLFCEWTGETVSRGICPGGWGGVLFTFNCHPLRFALFRPVHPALSPPASPCPCLAALLC